MFGAGSSDPVAWQRATCCSRMIICPPSLIVTLVCNILQYVTLLIELIYCVNCCRFQRPNGQHDRGLLPAEREVFQRASRGLRELHQPAAKQTGRVDWSVRNDVINFMFCFSQVRGLETACWQQGKWRFCLLLMLYTGLLDPVSPWRR